MRWIGFIHRGCALLLGAGLVATLGGAGPAFGEAPLIAGWWTSADPGSGSLPVGTSEPDVPPGGLLVASDGSTSAPLALAALAYTSAPPPGSSASLTLQVAPNSATTPKATLELCPLTVDGFQPASGGPMSEAPRYDCSKHVSADISADGKSFSFDLGALLTGAPLAFAILPAAAIERVVLSKPDDGSLAVAAPAASGPSGYQQAAGAAAPANGVPASASGSPVAVSAPAAASPAPPATGAVAVAAPAAAGSATAPQAAALNPSIASAAAPSGNGRSTTGAPAAGTVGGAATGPVTLGATTLRPSRSMAPLVAILAVAGLVLAALLWGYAGSAARRQVSGETA